MTKYGSLAWVLEQQVKKQTKQTTDVQPTTEPAGHWMVVHCVEAKQQQLWDAITPKNNASSLSNSEVQNSKDFTPHGFPTGSHVLSTLNAKF